MRACTVVSLTNSSCRDLGVGEPARHQPQHLAARGRSARRAPPARSCPVRGRRTKSSTSRRVSAGASRASPAATVRTPRRAASRGDVLEQEAARAGAQRLVDVLVEVERGQHQHLRRAARPSAAGASPRSRRGRACGCPSGRRRAAARARARPRRAPSAASPTTSRSSSASRISAEPGPHERLVVGDQDADHRSSEREPCAHDEAAVRHARPASQLAAEERDPLAHAGQAVARRGVARVARGRRRRSPARARRSP